MSEYMVYILPRDIFSRIEAGYRATAIYTTQVRSLLLLFSFLVFTLKLCWVGLILYKQL